MFLTMWTQEILICCSLRFVQWAGWHTRLRRVLGPIVLHKTEAGGEVVITGITLEHTRVFVHVSFHVCSPGTCYLTIGTLESAMVVLREIVNRRN